MPELGPIGTAYRETRERIVDLVADLDDARLATPAPACPGWSVRNVVAHLAGAMADAVDGNLAAATGRRSVEQIERLQWAGDREASLSGFSWMGLQPAAAPIDE